MHKKIIFTALAAALACTITGCAKNSAAAASLAAAVSDQSSPTEMVESAVSSVNSALNDAEQVTVYAKAATPLQRFSDFLIPSAWAGSCGLTRFSPSIGTANCKGTASNATVTSNFNGCTAGESGEYLLGGSETLSFDSEPTCDTWIGGTIPTSGTLTRTSTNFAQQNPDGSVVSMVSTASTNYLGSSIGGGTRTAFSAQERSVTILGLHRTHVFSGNVPGFDHSIYTTDTIDATGLKANGTRKIISGTVRVDNNTAQFSTSFSLAGLSWSASCCYPTSGNVGFAVAIKNSSTGLSTTTNYTATFSPANCGQINLSNMTGGTIASAQLAACD